MSLVSKVTERVRSYYKYGGSRYTDTRLQAMVHAADCAIREYAEPTVATVDIPLLAETLYYPMPSDVVRVRSVLYSSDGVNFVDGVLKPFVVSDLDTTYRLWINNTGVTPEHYGILSTPGTPGCYLVVWMPLLTVTTQKVRIEYTKCYDENDSTFEAVDDLDDWILDTCHVPHVLSQIYAMENIDKFKGYWTEYMAGVEKARCHFANRHTSISPRSGVGMSDGQLL